jgi:hypothetical protein
VTDHDRHSASSDLVAHTAACQAESARLNELTVINEAENIVTGHGLEELIAAFTAAVRRCDAARDEVVRAHADGDPVQLTAAHERAATAIRLSSGDGGLAATGLVEQVAVLGAVHRGDRFIFGETAGPPRQHPAMSGDGHGDLGASVAADPDITDRQRHHSSLWPGFLSGAGSRRRCGVSGLPELLGRPLELADRIGQPAACRHRPQIPRVRTRIGSALTGPLGSVPADRLTPLGDLPERHIGGRHGLGERLRRLLFLRHHLTPPAVWRMFSPL